MHKQNITKNDRKFVDDCVLNLFLSIKLTILILFDGTNSFQRSNFFDKPAMNYICYCQ